MRLFKFLPLLLFPTIAGAQPYQSLWNGTNKADVTVGHALKTDSSATTQPVSAASLPLPSLAATSTKQSDGSQKSQLVDGSGNVISATSNHLDVNVANTVTVGSHAVTNAGTFATQATEADGANTTLGAKADAKNAATDTTAVSAMSVLKQISASVQAPPSQAVTNAGIFTTQSACTIADAADVTLGAKADAKSTATDTTSISAMSVLKEISAMEQAPASRAVTNAGTFPVQATLQANSGVDIGKLTANQSVNAAQINGATPLMGNGATGTGALRVSIANDSTGVVQPGNTANTTPWLMTPTPGTTGGWSVSSQTTLSSTKAQIKGSAGTLGGYMVYNGNASVEYVQVWDLASASITVGTTAPTYVIPIPASSGANVEFTNGINHGTGITVAFTTTPTGLTGPGTNLVGFFLYK